MSLSCNRLPRELKTARVTPVYKGKGSEEDPGGYRPISVVPHIAKLVEKSVQKQLMSYLMEHSLITSNQSAFIPGHSTHTCTHKVIDDLLDNINEGYINGSCFFDLSKCFDTIDHELLLFKLERYGIGGNALQWFSDYLADRTQAVRFQNQLSDLKSISTGVPQGSVLGPILFLIFINDLPSCLRNSSCSLFADDTEIHCCGSTIEEVERLLQQDVDNITEWFRRNRLTVNSTKSFSMIFSSNKTVNNTGLRITIASNPIACKPSARYLGIYPDSNFSWIDHISELCKNVSPKVALLSKLKSLLPIEHVEQVYTSTIQPLIDYCITSWGFAAKKHVNKVQRLQNRAARIITGNFSWETRGIDLVEQLGWQSVVQRRDYFTAVLVFKALNGIAPVYIQDLFTFCHDINIRSTRNTAGNNLYVPQINKCVFGQSLQYNGARIWNELPDNVKNANTLSAFKRLSKLCFTS
jgi:hypothetical protein